MPTSAQQRAALAVTAFGSFLTPFMSSAVTVALPSIGREFGLGSVLLGWVATAFLLAAAVGLVPAGRLADLHGRKRFFLWGLALSALAALLSALAPSGGWLIAFRALHGLAGALLFATSLAILSAVFPPGERGRVIGFSVAMTYLGLSLGPVLGGVLTQQFGWRSLFAVLAPASAGLWWVAWRYLEGEWAPAQGQRFDGAGTLLYGASLCALMLGLTHLPGRSGLALLAAAAAGFWCFGRWELRHASPVLDLRIFLANRRFTFSTLAALINYSATFAATFLLSLYLQEVRGLAPQQAGLVLLAQPAVMALFSPLAGHWSDRVEPGHVASAGMGLTALGLLGFSFLGPATAWSALVAGQLVMGLGFALFSSPNTNAVMGAVAPREYGVAAASLATMRLTGQMLSMGITLLLIAWVGGGARGAVLPSGRLLAVNRLAFWIYTGLCLLGVYASLARGTRRDRPAGAPAV